MISGFAVLLALAAPSCLAVPVADPVADASADAYASDYSHYIPAPSSQYHAQDDFGGYNYGFASGDQQKTETTNYISDALGFRVAATNLPVHHVEGEVAAPVAAVAAAPVVEAVAAPVATVAAAPVAYDHAMVASVPYSYLPYATNYGYQYATPAVAAPVAHTVHAATANVAYAAPAAVVHTAAAPVVHDAVPVVHAAAAPVVHAAAAPIVHAAAPIVHAAAPVVTGSQYHAQDEAGQYAFGYNDLNSVRQETKTADGAVSGAYQYVDSDGLIQTVQYIADDAGFRVAGTNLPVFAAAVPADTPEVAAAKVQHAHAVAEANAIHAADAATYVAAAPVPVPAIQAPAVVNAAAEGYYGAANVYAAAPAVVAAAPAIVAAAPSYPETAEAAEAVAQYYGAANVYSAGTPVYAAVAPAVHAGIHSSPIAVASVAPVAVASADPVIVAPEATGYQYHSQDDIGQYSFGYADGNSGKQEIKTADGVVRGSYSYVDSDGIVQTVNYIADALGFRVGATNLPVHNVDAATAVAAEPAVAVAAAAPAVKVAAAPAMYPQVAYSYLPYAVNYGYHNAAPVAVAAAAASPVTAEVAPVAVAAAPAVEPVAHTASAVPIVAAPAATVSSQFHAQDEFGAYSYGYNSPDQAKSEVKSADGVTRGSYSYVDANGLLQTVNYISDAMGFRVAATNLPVHHVEGAEVDDAAVVEAAKYNVLTPSVNYAYLPYAANYEYLHAEPAAIAAAAA